MASYDELLREYQEYIEEKNALAALAGSAAVAIGGAHFMNKDAQASDPQTQSQRAPGWGEGDWFAKDTPDGAIDYPADGVEEPEVKTKATAGNYKREDLDQLAMTLWGEARSEGANGMAAVAHVIINRSEHRRWKGSIKSVVHADRQFSCWNKGDPNRARMLKMQEFYNYLQSKPEGWEQWYAGFQKSPDFKDYQYYLQARKVAREVLDGKRKDVTGGALFYHTTGVSPTWSTGQKVTAQVGDHLFYVTDRKA